MKINRSFPFLAMFLIMISVFGNPQNPQKPQNRQSARPANSPGGDFTISWKQVDSLTNLGQPKSALAIVDKIYAQAKTGKNDPQVIKAIMYGIRLKADFQENFMALAIADLQKEISASSQPVKQMLQSILAEVYLKYYQNNQFRFRNRTQVQASLPDSLETWDLASISGAITKNYLLSLDNPDSLKRIPITQFDAILDQEVFGEGKRDVRASEAARFTPTLYDFLAGRALDYFTSADAGRQAQHFEVDQPWYFAQSFNFTMNRMMIPADPSASASYALRIFRDLANFHLKDKDPRALIDIELKRFAFVHENYTLPGKDSLYLDALRQFEQAEIGSPWSSLVSYALAVFLNGQGQLYVPLASGLHKWDVRSALEVCDRAIKRYPDSEGSKNCKILATSVREPGLQITTESAVPTNKPSLGLIGVKNIKQLFFRLVRTDPETYSEKSGMYDHEMYFKFLTDLPFAKSWSQNFPDDGDYQKHQAEIPIPEVPAGFWVLLCSAGKDFTDSKQVFAFTPFWSTQISYISKRNNDGSYSYFLVDRETGMPLRNVVAEAWEKNYNYRERKYTTLKLQNYTSDEQGYFLIPPSSDNGQNSNRFLKIHDKGDSLITDHFYQYPLYKGQVQTIVQTQFYTDRAIYRPGQIVYFKGIILSRTGDKSEISVNHATKVVFTDANGQKVSEQSLVSNQFGSVNGSFIAPAGVLLGQMTISNESGSTTISVEEYKRPTFDVSCAPLEGNYRLGETISLTGKALAFAGNPIDAARVKYRVTRTARFPYWDRGWWWPMPASPPVEITNGTTTTDAGGNFTVPFTAIPDNSIDRKTWPVFDFSVSADVTDINGETQSAEQSVSIGYKSLLIESNIPETINLAKDTIFKISTTNLNGRSTPAMVTITLQRLHQPGRAFKPRLWERPDLNLMTQDEFHAQFPDDVYGDENNPATWAKEETVVEKTINTANDSIFGILDPVTRLLRSGSYLMVLKATDPYGEAVEVIRYLTVFSPASKEVPVNAISWVVPLKTSGEPGESARFLIGSREENVNMIYEIRIDDSLISREYIKLNNRAMLVEIPITEQYRGNFSVNFMFVRLNRVFQNSLIVSVPHVNKKLGISFETFRSKLEPGAKESWKIKISGPNGKPAVAEFMGAMYDASLDLFRTNTWAFDLYRRYSGIIPWDINNAFRTSTAQWMASNESGNAYLFHPGLKLNWFGASYFGGNTRYSRHYAAGGRDKSRQMEMMDTPATTSVLTSGMDTPPEPGMQKVADTAAVSGSKLPSMKAKPEPAIQIRRDFRETAFFYPTLETDSAGNLSLKFTAPESLTSWKFLGLAHAKNLDYALVEKELVTRKDLMVFPNPPRFVRQGDTLIFSAKIVNLSDHPLSGEVILDLVDAITLQPLNNLLITTEDPMHQDRHQLFLIDQGQSSLVSWKIAVPFTASLSLLQYRITAVSGSFSDGEEKAIPVLTNRTLVTESLPLPIRGKGTAFFSFDKLLKSGMQDSGAATLKNYTLTLEFASNPAWYAIQALPSLNEKQYDNADAIFSAFWSNSVAAFIANSNPKIKAVFESWKSLTPDALQSNLAKNQELKSALLQETPWVMEAASETGRKQKLGLFFDLDNIGANLQENLKKLKKLQTPNGGWTWFAGMPENRYITQAILSGLGQLDHLGITNILQDQTSREMVVKAIGFLDGEIQKDYESLKKIPSVNLGDNHLGSSQIQYLYARSFFTGNPGSGIPEPGSAFKEAFGYYKSQAEKYWLQNDRYLQGMVALALNRMGNRDIPALILKSFSEKALHNNEMGMYWASEQGYFWYQAPIETQALMIEAFDEIAGDKSTVDELKIWLLKQKQTQDWRYPKATLQACYALLLRGTDLLADDPDVKISLGKEKISSAGLTDVKKEAGTGYFQLSWSGNEIQPEMGNITVSKSGDGVAWGAVYWQYFENLDKITPASTPMKLEKKLFIERNTPSGPVLEPISNFKSQTSNFELNPGDKIVVRIVLSVDRDLEFVHMKDMRASGLEPLSPASSSKREGQTGDGLSGYRYQEGLGYYQSTTDQATNFFFDYLPKGSYVFEYALKVNAAGAYSNGITTIQCMYAPEFTAHSEGIRIKIK
ncbi:MAG: MG2 domain-containing protein [Bacteroidetes bacterium]|nr:MG2 domain-containing protein [Bacteroidota bacterium]